jgi:hypothetical protein
MLSTRMSSRRFPTVTAPKWRDAYTEQGSDRVRLTFQMFKNVQDSLAVLEVEGDGGSPGESKFCCAVEITWYAICDV